MFGEYFPLKIVGKYYTYLLCRFENRFFFPSSPLQIAMFIQVTFQLGLNPNQILKLCVHRTVYSIHVIKALLIISLITWSEQKLYNLHYYYYRNGSVCIGYCILDACHWTPDTGHIQLTMIISKIDKFIITAMSHELSAFITNIIYFVWCRKKIIQLWLHQIGCRNIDWINTIVSRTRNNGPSNRK